MPVFLFEGLQIDNERPIRIITYPPQPIEGKKFVIVVINESPNAYNPTVYVVKHDYAGNVIEYSKYPSPVGVLYPGDSFTIIYPKEDVKAYTSDGRRIFYSIMAVDKNTGKQISGNCLLYASGSAVVKAVYTDSTGKEIPLVGANVRLWRNPFTIPELYTTDINGEVRLPDLRQGERGKAILEIEKKTATGNMYYYCEAWNGNAKKIVVPYGYAFMVTVEIKLIDLKAWLSQVYSEAYPDAPPGAGEMLWKYFVWINNQPWDVNTKKYHMKNVVSALVHDLICRNVENYADALNRIIGIDINYDQQKIILTLRPGVDPWLILAIVGLIVGGTVLYKLMDYLTVKVAYEKAVEETKTQQEIINEILNGIQQGIISKEVGEEIIRKITEYSQGMSRSTQDVVSGASNVLMTVVAILPLLLIAMLIKSIRGVVKK